MLAWLANWGSVLLGLLLGGLATYLVRGHLSRRRLGHRDSHVEVFNRDINPPDFQAQLRTMRDADEVERSSAADSQIANGNDAELTTLLKDDFRPRQPPIERNYDASNDLFRLTAFAPDIAAPGETLLLQAYVHLDSQTPLIGRIASERDHDAVSRGTTPLSVFPTFGEKIRVTLAAPGLSIAEPEHFLEWVGQPVSADFDVTLPHQPTSTAYTLTLRVEISGLPVGSMKLRLAVQSPAPIVVGAQTFAGAAGLPAARSSRRSVSCPAFRYVFLSYSSKDRQRVLDVAQGFDRLGIQFFQDVLTLRAGDDWQERISAEIARSDAFMLFWSKAAAQSEWVTREAELALTLQKASPVGAPQILPFILDQPPPPPPPSLALIHFNDPISCVRSAHTPQ